MQKWTWTQIVLGLIVVVAMATPGCSCGSDTDAATTGPPGTTSSSSGGGQGGAGGQGGSGGQGGGMAADNGVPGMDIVTAGDTVKSPNYTMIFSFGQSTQNQERTTSPGYQMQGGLIGATGSK